MTPEQRKQLLDLAAAFGPSIVSGIGQAGRATADRALIEQDRARQAEQELYNRRMAARGGLAGFFQNQLNRDINAAGDFAAQSPLGAEQALARQMARQRAGADAVRQYKPPTGMSPAASAFAAQQQNFLAPFASADYQATVSPEATARSIAERRKALAGIDPNFQFGSMGDYGLPDLGGEVSQYQGDVRSRRQASEMDLQRLLTEQMREASAAQIPGAQTSTATGASTASKKKSPSLLRRIAGAALPVAAAFIPGGAAMGPVLSTLIQAGAGAAGSALAGGGLKGALTGAAMGGLGAATGGLGSAAGRRVAGETTKSFIQRAILDPRALTQIAGGALGGDTGAALQAASLGMPGARRPGAPDTSFEQQGLSGNILPGGGQYADMVTSVGTGPLDTSFERRDVPGLLPGGGTLTTDIGPAPRRQAEAARQTILRGVNLGSLSSPSMPNATPPRSPGSATAGGATVNYGTPSWIKPTPRAANESRVPTPLDAAYGDIVRSQASGRSSSGLANMPEDSLGLLKAAESFIEASPAMIATQVGAAAAPMAPAAFGRIASVVRGTPPIQMEFGKTMTGTQHVKLMQQFQKAQEFLAKHKRVMNDPNTQSAVKARWNASPQVQDALTRALELMRRAESGGF